MLGELYYAIPLSWDKCTKRYYSVICQSWHFWSWHFGSWYFRSWHFGSWDYPLTLFHHTLFHITLSFLLTCISRSSCHPSWGNLLIFVIRSSSWFLNWPLMPFYNSYTLMTLPVVLPLIPTHSHHHPPLLRTETSSTSCSHRWWGGVSPTPRTSTTGATGTTIFGSLDQLWPFWSPKLTCCIHE